MYEWIPQENFENICYTAPSGSPARENYVRNAVNNEI